MRATGEREVLGFAVGASEGVGYNAASFWLEFLRSLVHHGLQGVQLAISDAHEGLRAALGQVLSGASWQRCRVHFMRNVLAHVTKADRSVVAAALRRCLHRTIFAQPDRPSAGQQLALVAEKMAPRWPKAAELLRAAEEEVLAYMAFPEAHWTRLYSTNPLERLNDGSEAAARSNAARTSWGSFLMWPRWSAWWGRY